MLEYEYLENDIKNKVDYYYNFNNIDYININVKSKYKGLGEASILIEAINKINTLNTQYKNIFKLSGRYYLNNNFDYKIFENEDNVFTNWDASDISYCTIFYKINFKDIYLFKNSLNNSVNELNNGNSIEHCLYKYFNYNVNIVNKLNVTGFLATEGYLFSV
jgi:hypothetical protein